MNKIFLFLIAAVLGLSRASAALSMTVSEIYYNDGYGYWGINIGIMNDGAPVNAFQCDVAIPADFEFAASGETLLTAFTSRVPSTSGLGGQVSYSHTCAASVRSNGTLRLVVYSVENTVFDGAEGDVIFVALDRADDTAVMPASLKVNLTNQVLTYIDGAEVRSVYPDGIVNDETLVCYDSKGNHVAMYALGYYPSEDALYEDVRAVNEDLATNDRAVTVDMTRFLYYGTITFKPKNPNALFFCGFSGQIQNTENVFCENGETGLWECQDLVLHDDGLSFEMPEGREAVARSFTFDRTFPAGQWSTVMLPVTLNREQVEAMTASGVELARLAGYDEELSQVTYATSGSFEANVPYFVRPSSASQVFAGLSDLPVEATVVTTVPSAGRLSMYGNYDYRLISSEPGLFRYGYDVTTGDFVKIGNNGRLGPFRCYLELAGVSEAKAAPRITIKADGGDITAIEDIRGGVSGPAAPMKIYTVDGRRVNAATVDELPAGVYVVNGRKVVRPAAKQK